MQKSIKQLTTYSKVIFWDFDGVIKDSVEAKSLAFENIFSSYGSNISNKVRLHHERNGGISRYEKIPLYLSWVDEKITDEKIQRFCNKFSLIVRQSVTESPWVPGVLSFIKNNYKKNKNILVTATPKGEIDEILKILKIEYLFDRVYGAPATKKNIISAELERLSIVPSDAIMFGDSHSDYDAAKYNNILFILRATELNKMLQKKCKERTIRDFNDE